MPLWCHNHIIFQWARLFGLDTDGNYDGTITKLNFHHFLFKKPSDQEKFLSLANLPFSPHLAHIDLSESKIGEFPTLVKFLSHPIFQHLATLNLSSSQLKSLDELFTPTTSFPNLHTLDLSDNYSLRISTTTNPETFPQLKVLKLDKKVPPSDRILNTFLNLPPPSQQPSSSSSSSSSSLSSLSSSPLPQSTPTPTPTTHHPSFRLEKLHLHNIRDNFSSIQHIFSSPALSQLKELTIEYYRFQESDITFLFGQDGVLKNLTHLDLRGCILDHAPLQALAQSPYLSNLTTLKLEARLFTPVEGESLGIQVLSQSPYLWLSKLKHLSLCNYSIPSCFSFFSPSPSPELASLFTALETANVKLETFDLGDGEDGWTYLDWISTSPSLSQLKVLAPFDLDIGTSSTTTTTSTTTTMKSESSDERWDAALKRFAQSPNLSNLTKFTTPALIRRRWSREDLESLFTSPTMSNDLIELKINSRNGDITDDLMETILAARVVPGDETSPLKYGKLQKLDLSDSHIGPRTVELIVQNFPHLTHLDLCCCEKINNDAITALIGHEHDDIRDPSPALPNLRSLDISQCSITSKGLIELSKSQLLDQLEHLNFRGDDRARDVGEGTGAIAKTPLFSNMESIIWNQPVHHFAVDISSCPHLDNCKVSQRKHG